MIFLDTETIGLTSPLILVQFSDGFTAPRLWPIWNAPVKSTLDLFEWFCKHTVVAWNISFDWFQINKWYNILKLYAERHGADRPPSPALAWECEQDTPREWCLKPTDALDLMIIARREKYQHLMNFKPGVLRGVPDLIADDLADLIISKVDTGKIPGTVISYKKDKNDKRPGLVDLKFKFKGSTSLKYIHELITGKPLFGHWGDFYQVKEYGHAYRPWGGYWQGEVSRIQRKGFTSEQLEYAYKDIIMLQEVYPHLGPYKEVEVDSRLAAAVGAMRWKGYSVDLSKTDKYWVDPDHSVPTYHAHVKSYVGKAMNDIERLALKSTRKQDLYKILQWTLEDGSKHPAAERVEKVNAERKNMHTRNLIIYLRDAKGLFPDVKVGGTLTNRVAGGSAEGATKKSGSINCTGIDKGPIRELFTFAYPGEEFSGGDFKAFEISIMDRVWGSAKLHEELLRGKKMIALFGERIFERPYAEVLASDKEGEGSMYDRAKKGFYARAYGGQVQKLSEVFRLDKETTAAKLREFDDHYQISGHYKELTEKLTCLHEWQWSEPINYVETILGYKRYFNVEQCFAKACYDTIYSMPDDWAKMNQIYRRKDKAQTTVQVVRSALYGCILATQAKIIRVAGNFEIQSPGAELNKWLQERLWRVQDCGVSHWKVRPMNVHDEECVAHIAAVRQTLRIIVDAFIIEHRKYVPLLAMDWKDQLKDWSEK